MNDNQLDRQVERAFERATPDVLNSVLSDCREQKGNVIVINNRSRKAFWRTAAGIAAALVLLIGSTTGIACYSLSHTPGYVVSLDVNPSIEIKANRSEKVISVTGLNDDGITVIGDMDFEGSSIDVTVNALIGSMLRNGYLSEMSNSILVSVDSKNADTAAALELKLSADVNKQLQTGSFSGSVLSQVVTNDKELKTLAAEYGISVGKAQLIENIAASDPRYSFEALAGLNINDLNLIRSSISLPIGGISAQGSASDKKYIGHDSAISMALTDAGLSLADISNAKAEYDIENGAMVYDVEFEAGRCQYEYDIDAATGEIISVSRRLPDAIEALAEQYSDQWEEWAKSHSDEWEAWAEQYSGDWEAWAIDHADQVEAWAQDYAGSWEDWAEAWGAWANKYFDF